MATGDFPCTPVYEEGDRLNCVAGTSGNVQGKRFVVAAADKQPGWAGLTTSTAGGRIIVARAAASTWRPARRAATASRVPPSATTPSSSSTE
jgi:hypothetical protein